MAENAVISSAIRVAASFDIMEIKYGVQLYRNPVQTMEKI